MTARRVNAVAAQSLRVADDDMEIVQDSDNLAGYVWGAPRTGARERGER